MSTPKISIITVSYNAVSTIEKTIESVLSQKYDNFEYIIIDGGSKDGTVDIIRKYDDRLAYWVSEPDNGIYDAMNKGVIHANGKYCYFLGADDYLRPEAFLFMKGILAKDDEILYGNVVFQPQNIIYDGKFSKFKLCIRNICHQAILYPTELLRANPYNLRYKICSDYDLNLKLAGQGIKFRYIDSVIAEFRTDGKSSNGDEVFAAEAHLLKKKYFGVWFMVIFRSLNKWKLIK